jgi:hypothetical protein
MTVYEGNIKPSSIEQATLETDLSATRITEIASNQKKRFEYDGNNNAIYIGYAAKGLAESSDGRLLWKLTWTGANCTAIDIAYGSWTLRADPSTIYN